MSYEDAEYNSDSINELIDRGYVQCEEGVISIDFLDEQLDEYDQIVEKRREAGRKGGKARGKQTQASAKQVLSKPEASAKQTEADEMKLDERDEIRLDERDETRESNKRADALPSSGDVLVSGNSEKPNTHTTEPQEKEKVAPKRKVFTPPTIEELREFFGEVNMIYEADKFFDYYTANGWMVGKVKMKDWKATARNWARRKQEYSQSKPQSNGKPFADLTAERFVDSVKAHVEKKQRDRANGYR